MGPGGFLFGRVAVANALHVEGFVNVFEEREPDDAVICAFVFCEGGEAEGSGLVVSGVYAGGVKNFVDAERISMMLESGCCLGKGRRTMENRHLVGGHRP